MKDGKITNDNRIVAALPTIKHILENGGRAVLSLIQVKLILKKIKHLNHYAQQLSV